MEIFYEQSPPQQYSTLNTLKPHLLVHDSKLPPSPSCASYSIEAGEKAKSLEEAERLFKEMDRLGVDRRSLIACAGGGTLSDLTGFCASVYLRGVELVLIPTTLLAMIDAAVGGKNGVNFAGKKNAIGTLCHPKTLIINPLWLQSLPWKEYKQGLAEAVKYGVIAGDPFLNFLENNVQAIQNQEPNTLNSLIRRCIEIKLQIVKDSEQSPEVRDLLNLGHTFAHAIEAETAFQVPHGEAVAMGLIKALTFSEIKCGIDRKETLRVKRLLEAFDLPTGDLAIDKTRLLHWMQQDKKNRCGKICLILASGMGNVARFTDIPLEEIREHL